MNIFKKSIIFTLAFVLLTAAFPAYGLVDAVPISVEVTALELPYADAADIQEWAIPHVKYCTDNGLLLGHDNGSFEPKGNVTREQLAAVIDRMIPEAGRISVISPGVGPKDLSKDAWSYGAVTQNIALGYMKQNVNDGSFAPRAYATRAEVAYAVASLLELLDDSTIGLALSRYNADTAGSFTDLEGIDSMVFYSILVLNEENIMVGHERKFRPHDPLTRQELAKILHLICE